MDWPKTGWPNFPFGAFLCQKTTVEHRYRGAVLWIFGFGPLDGVGSYKRWTTLTNGGTITQGVYEATLDGDGNVLEWCGNLLLSLSLTRGGSCVYSLNPNYPNGENPIMSDTRTSEGAVDGLGDYTVATTDWTETSETITGTGDCVMFDVDQLSRITTGTISTVLTGEYTADMAIANFQTYATWSAWEDGDGSPGITEQRSEVSPSYAYPYTPMFAYRNVEWRVTRSGLKPSTAYDCTMKAYRSPLNGYSFEYYADITVNGTTDATGTLVVVGQIPNDIGYETYVQGPPEIAEA